jgi:hypothetical protein
MCVTATSMVDSHCNQVLRSTIQTETLRGPGGYRVNNHSNGTTRLMLSQWPITSVIAIRVAPASVLPYKFTSVTTGQWAVERPALLLPGTSVAADSGTGGQSVILGPGWVPGGRGAWVIETTYAAGWPHCGLAQAAGVGDVILNVDDCSGWAPPLTGGPGATGVLQDTTGNQEAVTCLASSVPTGPGVLTLAAPLAYAHPPGVLVSCLPGQVQWASALYAASQALTRGSTSTTIQASRGGAQRSAGGGGTLKMQGDEMLCPFKRVI